MGAITRQLMSEVAQSKTKGKAFVAELNAKLSPSSIAKANVKTQGCDKKK